MKTAPVARLFAPAVLPVFDDSWKDKCATCVHLNRGPSSSEWRCRKTTMEDVRPKKPTGLGWQHLKGPAIGAYCIDAREERKPCGPDARLWNSWEINCA
jgi:hypothetical protein